MYSGLFRVVAGLMQPLQMFVRLHCSWLNSRLRVDVSEEDTGWKRWKQWEALDLALTDPVVRLRVCATACFAAQTDWLQLGLRHARQAPKTTLAPPLLCHP